MALYRKNVPTVLTLQPLLAGIEPEIFIPFAGLLGLVIYTAQSNVWNLLVAAAVWPPLYVILRRRTEKDPFFFRVFKHGLSFPKFLPAKSGLWAGADSVKIFHKIK